MKLSASALSRALATGLEPLYVILGEEPLTAFEAADAVRVAARKAGFNARIPLFVESGFDWGRLAAEGATGSLFGDKQLLDLKLPNGKTDETGSRALTEYAAAPPPDALLLVTAPGAERKTANTAWAKAAAKTGVLVECRPLKSEQMPDWIAARLRDRRLQVPPEGARLIAEYAQGTLFAAAQAIERLTLIVPEGRADLATVREAVVDEARYGTFECVDAALAGDAAGALRMMVRLAETGTVPPQILWVVARELRVLESWCWAAEHGGPRPNVWDSRRNLVATAARRRSVRGWQALVIAAAEVDRAIKGRAPGDAWVLLERLLLAIASAPLAEAA